MSTPFTKARMIANRMITGCNNYRVDPKVAQAFEKRHQKLINYMVNLVPRKTSVGITAALAKAILWYGEDKIKPLCERIAKKDFRGADDPVLALYDWLIKRSRGRCNTDEIYRVTITVIRFYLRDGKVVASNYLRPANSDIFEWENDYMTMVKPKIKNQYTKAEDESNVEEYLDICSMRGLD